jgi:hypothetical protein
MVLGVWQRYAALPRKVRLWVGLSTLAIAYCGNQIMNRMYEDEELRREAERRISLEQDERR